MKTDPGRRAAQSPERRRRAVFLVGFMGAGKTSVGREIAGRLGWRFLDLDDVVEQREKRTVAEIFDSSGEAAFRRAETAALRSVLDRLDRDAPLVAALGGGAFVQDENAWLLAEAGEPMVFLDAPYEELRSRCGQAAGLRPLFADESRFRELYETRRPHYLRAQLRVDTAGKDVAAVAAAVMERLGLQKQLGR